MTEPKIKIGISSCLLGHKVRYHGGHKYNKYIVEILSEHFEFIPFCPEVEIGMGVPRDPIQLEWIKNQARCVGVDDKRKNMTDKLVDCANQQQNWHKDICGYIFKKNSPSCGMQSVPLFKNGVSDPVGQGIYAIQIMKTFPRLPVAEEDQMENPQLREQFIKRVMVYMNNRNP